MRTLLFILSVSLSILLLSLVVEGAKRLASGDLQGNPPKRRRIVLTREPGQGDHIESLFQEPRLNAILPSHRQLMRHQHGREVEHELGRKKRGSIGVVTRRLFELLRDGDRDRDGVFVKLRKLEFDFYNRFAKFTHITANPKDGRIHMPNWVQAAINYILPHAKFASAGGLDENLVKSLLVKHHDGVFYFSPLALFRMMMSVEADISWRFTRAVLPVDNHAVLSELELLPRDLLLDIFNIILVKTPHSFHLLRQVCRSFYHLNPLTSLSQHHSTDQAALARYVGLYVAAEPSVYLGHVHRRSLLFTGWSQDQHERYLCDFRYLMRDEMEGYLILGDLTSTPLDHERLTRQLQTYADNGLGALKFLVSRVEELTQLIKSTDSMYAFLTINRIFIDTIVGWCANRFNSMPAALQVALRKLFLSFAVFLVPAVRDCAFTDRSMTANMEYLRKRSVLDLIL